MKNGKIMVKGLSIAFVLIALENGIAAEFLSIHGQYKLDKEWTLTLPTEFKTRIEDGDLVIWKPGLTFWITIWGNAQSRSVAYRLKNIKEESAPKKANEIMNESNGQVLYSYELIERDEERLIKEYLAIYAYKISDSGHVQITAYVDSNKDKNMAYEVIKSLKGIPKK
jgi:hypothetical protein